MQDPYIFVLFIPPFKVSNKSQLYRWILAFNFRYMTLHLQDALMLFNMVEGDIFSMLPCGT